MSLLITGAAGFIGYHLSQRLAADGQQIIGIDNLNDYYDPALKYGRLAELGVRKEAIKPGFLTESDDYPNFRFAQLDLADRKGMEALFAEEKITRVVNLAAQAGVRYSLLNPHAYAESNLVGFVNLLDCCRHANVEHLVYASSSSVYGLNQTSPFSVSHNVDHPVSLYAATKKSNELMAHAYSHLYGLPTTGLRFFTVYGPWGRPDMAYFLFTKAILRGEAINVFNNGFLYRDFTYIDDIIEGLVRVIEKAPVGNPNWDALHPDPASSKAPYRLYNIGNNRPVKLLDFIATLEDLLGKEAIKNFLPMQPGDVDSTCADIDDLQRDFGFSPKTELREGLRRFVEWYRGK
ncbi:MAG: NAD-dependent epimerase [Lewinellaceae bacterium]|nr:NAD-dependent epimerase [Lewinellaceae bacterium]